MKHFESIVSLAALALVLASCEKQPAPPAPVETPSPATSTPASAELAPPGVFYLLAAARVETKDGITGLPPGTGVKLVRPGIYLTSVGEVPLKAAQLTNDMAKARAARDADRTAQAALGKHLAAQAQQASAAATVPKASVASAAPTMGSMAPPSVGSGDKAVKISLLEVQIASVQNDLANIETQIQQFNAHTAEVKDKLSPRRAERVSKASTLPDQKLQLEAQLRDLQMQLSELQRQ